MADRRTAAEAAALASMRRPMRIHHEQPTGGLRPHAKGKCSDRTGNTIPGPDCAQPATNGGGTSGNLRKSL